MAGVSLEAHRSLITRLHNDEKLSEGETVERLKEIGVDATTFDIYHHLEKWHIIPSPSPVLSLEADDVHERANSTRADRLTVKCYHGADFSHISQISLTSIPVDLTPLEKYQRDFQPHEKRAFDLRQDHTDLASLGTDDHDAKPSRAKSRESRKPRLRRRKWHS